MNNKFYSSISVIGGGAWGTAIASTLAKNQDCINSVSYTHLRAHET